MRGRVEGREKMKGVDKRRKRGGRERWWEHVSEGVGLRGKE